MDCVSKDNVAPLSSKLSGVRCTLKSALQSTFQTCSVLFDRPRDVFTDTLDRLGECVFCYMMLTSISLSNWVCSRCDDDTM